MTDNDGSGDYGGMSFAHTSELCSEAEKFLLLGVSGVKEGNVDLFPFSSSSLLLSSSFSSSSSSSSSSSRGSSSTVVRAIRTASSGILQRFKDATRDVESYKMTLVQKREQVHKMKENLLSVPVLEEYRQYVLAKRELDILECVRSLLRLRAWRTTREIPALVLAIRVPDGMTREMKVSRLLTEVVSELKTALLQRYHQGFGSSLSNNSVEGGTAVAAAESDGDGEEAIEREAERQRRQWATFIEETREWLVAYTLVALLPHTREDLRVVMERFQEALDTTLTPLWGRFSFHLVHARESRSVKQLLWTFAYARDFVSMLDTLCATLTQIPQGAAGASEEQDGDGNDTAKAEAPLIRLIRGLSSARTVTAIAGVGTGTATGTGTAGTDTGTADAASYAAAAKQYIVDKVCKFMRAHVAAVLADWHPLGDGTLFQLVESSLELDHFLYSEVLLLQGGSVSKSVSDSGCAISASARPVSAPMLGQSVAGLLYDVRELFLRWLGADLDHFQRLLTAELSGERATYELRTFDFQQLPVEAVPMKAQSLSQQQQQQQQHHVCCSGVHLCCHLFVLACTRYRHLPKQAQIVAAKCVLEPLLCCVNTVLLYRMYSHPLLQLIAKARQTLENLGSRSSRHIAGDNGNSIEGDLEGGGGLLATMGVRPQDTALFRKAAIEISASVAFVQFFLRQAVTTGNDIASIVVSAETETETGKWATAVSSSSSSMSCTINIDNYWRNCQPVIRAAARTKFLVVVDVPAAAATADGMSNSSSNLTVSNNNFNIVAFHEVLTKVLRRNATVAAIAQVCNPMLLNCNCGNQCVLSSVEFTCAQAQIMAATCTV